MPMKVWGLWLSLCVYVCWARLPFYASKYTLQKEVKLFCGNQILSTIVLVTTAIVYFIMWHMDLNWGNIFWSCWVFLKLNVKTRLYILKVVDPHETMRQCGIEDNIAIPFLASNYFWKLAWFLNQSRVLTRSGLRYPVLLHRDPENWLHMSGPLQSL